jgi:hypothetical protein
MNKKMAAVIHLLYLDETGDYEIIDENLIKYSFIGDVHIVEIYTREELLNQLKHAKDPQIKAKYNSLKLNDICPGWDRFYPDGNVPVGREQFYWRYLQ